MKSFYLAIEQIKGDDAIFSRKPPRLNARIPEIETIWNIAPSYKTSDPIPVRNAKNVLIATTWRTGSSFLGDILNHYPGTYYSYEPLHYLRNLVMKLQVFFRIPISFFFLGLQGRGPKDPWTKFLPVDAFKLTRDLYRCDYSTEITNAYLRHAAIPENQFLLKHNFRDDSNLFEISLIL